MKFPTYKFNLIDGSVVLVTFEKDCESFVRAVVKAPRWWFPWTLKTVSTRGFTTSLWLWEFVSMTTEERAREARKAALKWQAYVNDLKVYKP